MNETKNEELLKKLNGILNKPGGGQVVRFLLNSLGSVPIVGGTIAATSAIMGETEQLKFNELVIEWANSTEDNMNKILNILDTSKPTAASFALLIEEIFHKDIARDILLKKIKELSVILNSATVSELEPYIENNFVSIRSTGSMAQMGSGNRVGNHLEEIKRPYGLGSGFILTIKI